MEAATCGTELIGYPRDPANWTKFWTDSVSPWEIIGIFYLQHFMDTKLRWGRIPKLISTQSHPFGAYFLLDYTLKDPTSDLLQIITDDFAMVLGLVEWFPVLFL